MKTFFSYLDANIWIIIEKNKYRYNKITINNTSNNNRNKEG